MKFKLTRNIFYKKKKIEQLTLLLIGLVVAFNIVVFVLIPIKEIGIKKKNINKILKDKEVLGKEIKVAKEKRKIFNEELNKNMIAKKENKKAITKRSFKNTVEFEKTLEQVIKKLGIEVISIDESYLDNLNEIQDSEKFLTEFTLKGDGFKIAELYNIIENSSKLMFIKDKKFEILKEGKADVKTSFVIEYFILQRKGSDTEFIRNINENELDRLIKIYDQKRNIFKECLDKKEVFVKKKKINYIEILKKRFRLVGILSTEKSSSAIMYYRSPNKGLTRLIVADDKDIMLDGKRFDIEVSPTTVTIKNNGKLITKLHGNK